MARTMRIAYFSPLAPQRVGASDYSEELLPHLCRRLHVDVYTDDRIAATQEVGRIYPLYGYRDFPPQHDRYDQLLFQLGNSPEYVPIYDLFLRFGGVAVLHDLDLSRIIDAKTLEQGDSWGYLREVQRQEGLRPFLRTAGDALLRGQWPQPRQDGLEMNRRVVRQAEGIIVHSAAARDYLAARYPEARVADIPLGVAKPPLIDAAQARQALGLPADALVCLSVGRLGTEKRIHVAMHAFARLVERCPQALYVLLGEPAGGYPVQELALELGIASRVRLTGYIDLATLYRYLAACDVGICLRSPQRGEPSASLLRIMSMGRPVIVSSCEPFAQIPNDCVLKINPGAGEVAQIAAALWALGGHAPMRACYGRRAAHYVETQHSVATTARRYEEFLEELEAFGAGEPVAEVESAV